MERGPSRRTRNVVAAASIAVLAAACALLGHSRVKDGALYRTGEPQYDNFFKEVHELQLVDAAIADEKREARKPLVTALDLTPSAVDSTIAQISREQLEAAQTSLGATKLDVDASGAHFMTTSGKRGGPETEKLCVAIEVTANAEIKRAKELADVQPRAEALIKTGHELEPHVKEDFAKQGEKKPFEVRQEMTSALDVLSVVIYHSRREVKASQQFIADLQRAVAVGIPAPGATWPTMPPLPTPATSAAASAAAAASASPSSSADASAPPPPPPPPKPHYQPPPPPPAHTNPPPVATHAPPPPPPEPREPPKPPPPKPPPTGDVFNP